MLLNKTIACLALASAFSLGTANAAIVNPGFETGDLTGWKSLGQVSVVSTYTVLNSAGSINVSPISGSFMAVLTNTSTAPSLLLQDIPATTGTALTLWYRYIASDYTPFNDQFTATTKVKNGSLTDIDTIGVVSGSKVVGDHGDSGWLSYNLSDKTQLLKFFIQNQQDANLSGHAFIDIAAAVPEPEGYAMLLAGLGVMATIARRRRGTHA